MTTVYWSPVTEPSKNTGFAETPELQIIFSEPESLSKHLQKTRSGSAHMACPAFLDYIKNMFVIRAPLDMRIQLNRSKGTIEVFDVSESIQKFIMNRMHQTGKNSPWVLSLPPAYVFYSNKDVDIETTHAFMESNESISNIMLIPGTYNISKWIRLVDFSVEVKNDMEIINIKRGDVLMYVKFKTFDDSKVELERVPMTSELQTAINNCVSVKFQMSKMPLKTLYKMAESFMSTLSFKKTKKCPFGFKK